MHLVLLEVIAYKYFIKLYSGYLSPNRFKFTFVTMIGDSFIYIIFNYYFKRSVK